MRKRDGETREMRLVSRMIKDSDATGAQSLAEYLAVRRLPDSELWSTWDEVTIDLHNLTGEVITDVTLRRWATRYGIPDGDVTGNQFAEALAVAGISI